MIDNQIDQSVNAKPLFVTVAETAELLRLSRRMVQLMCAKGEIPSEKFGRCLRIPYAYLEKRAATCGTKIQAA
jgi:excisionase family DNA binding protein